MKVEVRLIAILIWYAFKKKLTIFDKYAFSKGTANNDLNNGEINYRFSTSEYNGGFCGR